MNRRLARGTGLLSFKKGTGMRRGRLVQVHSGRLWTMTQREELKHAKNISLPLNQWLAASMQPLPEPSMPFKVLLCWLVLVAQSWLKNSTDGGAPFISQHSGGAEITLTTSGLISVAPYLLNCSQWVRSIGKISLSWKLLTASNS